MVPREPKKPVSISIIITDFIRFVCRRVSVVTPGSTVTPVGLVPESVGGSYRGLAESGPWDAAAWGQRWVGHAGSGGLRRQSWSCGGLAKW